SFMVNGLAPANGGSGTVNQYIVFVPNVAPATAEYLELLNLGNSDALTFEAVRDNGLRIRLGTGAARRWYRIQNVDAAYVDGSTSCVAIRLAEPYSQVNTTGIPYEIELGPVALPGAEPIVLPQDIAIDLDASQIPFAWRLGNGSAPYSGNMDIMLTPTGKLQGSLATAGMLHFFFADRRDATENPASPLIAASYPYFGTIDDAYENRLVTLVTATAQTYGAEVDTTATGPMNTNRYRYAVYGKEDSN
ncbi:MAG: hypothetical protein KDA69_11300, partial [Planctomycetaceae bacterium]|nr:hypothetical protein [Planctomycetaceae bacterium]